MSYDNSYSDPFMDPFAQTAGTDDLFFDDDIVPIAEPVLEPETAPAPPEPPAEPTQANPPTGLGQSRHAIPRGPANNDRGGRGRGRGGRGGRGRGRGGSTQPTTNTSTTAPADALPKKDFQETNEPAVTPAAETPTPSKDEQPAAPPASTADTSATPPPPTSATKDTPSTTAAKPPTSVRGDRTLTGGPTRTRLTEDELAAKLSLMRSKNEALTAAHSRAEADAAESAAREAAAAKQSDARKKQQAERAKVDRQNRAMMMGERERNRQRKLDSLGGREWDEEKGDGFSGTGEDRGGVKAARGAHGGVAYTPRSDVENSRPKGTEWSPSENGEDGHHASSQRGDRGRGRAGRARGARGGTRGGRGDSSSSAQTRQHPPTAEDFPDLPSTSTPAAAASTTQDDAPKTLAFPIRTKTSEIKDAETAERPGVQKQSSFGLPSPMEKGKSWADQVEGI